MPITNRPKCTGHYNGEEDLISCDNYADFSYWREFKGKDESRHFCQPCHNLERGI